jgi:hypothetical protein
MFYNFPTTHSHTVLYIALYILESHSLQLLCQTFGLLQYTLFGNDSALTEHNTAFTQMEVEVFPLNLVVKYVIWS